MSELPDLALERWEPTKDTLRLGTQNVGVEGSATRSAMGELFVARRGGYYQLEGAWSVRTAGKPMHTFLRE